MRYETKYKFILTNEIFKINSEKKKIEFQNNTLIEITQIGQQVSHYLKIQNKRKPINVNKI